MNESENGKLPPCNIDAEQALLGMLLYDNTAFELIPDSFRPECFYEPFHARMYDYIAKTIALGVVAEPIMIMEQFRHDPAFEELGALRYLADLVDRAPARQRGYAELLHDLFLRRGLVRLAGAIEDTAARDKTIAGKAQIELAERALYDLASEKSGRGLHEFSAGLTKAVENVAAAYARDGELAGLSTGLHDLDRKLGGMHPSDLIILAGRPSMGKTALATNIAFHTAKRYRVEEVEGEQKVTAGGVVAFFSLEMSEEQLSHRILAEVSGISGDRMKKGEIDEAEFGRIYDAATEIADMPLYIDDTGAISISSIAARARRLKRTVGLHLVIVDYIQLVTSDGQSGHEKVTAVTQGLKALAKDLDIPVIGLSQVSRKCEERPDKRPQLADLRESGSIEQDADVVMFTYRDAYYMERAEPKEGTKEHLDWEEALDACRNTAEVIIGKQRHGPVGTVKVAFAGDTTKFSDAPRDR